MRIRTLFAGSTLLIVLVACGGAGPAATTKPAATPAPGATAAAPGATTAPAPTTPPAVATVAPLPTVAGVPGEIAACPLATKDEVTAAIGTTVVRTDDAGGACLWYGDGDSYLGGVSVVNDQYGLAALQPYLNDPGNIAVPGVGDKAVIYHTDTGQFSGRTIYVQKGDKGFHIDVLVDGMTDAQAKTALIALATTVAGRL